MKIFMVSRDCTKNGEYQYWAVNAVGEQEARNLVEEYVENAGDLEIDIPLEVELLSTESSHENEGILWTDLGGLE